MKDHREVLARSTRSAPRAPRMRAVAVGRGVAEDPVELLPQDDRARCVSRSGSTRYGGHSAGARRSSSQASRRATSVEVPAPDRDAAPRRCVRVATVRRRHWLSEAVLRPSPNLPEVALARTSGGCRSASPRRARARSSRCPSSATRIQESLALRGRRRSSTVRASGVDAVVDQVGDRARAGRSRCRAARSSAARAEGMTVGATRHRASTSLAACSWDGGGEPAAGRAVRSRAGTRRSAASRRGRRARRGRAARS